LLKLKKLHVLGFKSFCDRTELKFHGDGIAAIIGPNGCGKSNIADITGTRRRPVDPSGRCG
jgi:chromosome segregation protein